MIFPKKKRFIFLCASLMLFQGFLISGKASTCEAASSRYSKIATPKTSSYIYIRKSYNMNAEKVGKFYKGSGATIVKTGKVWLKVKSGPVTGYVKKSSVVSGAKLETYAAKNKFPKKLTINVRSLIVREKANKNSGIVTGVEKGETYKVISETKKWAKIKAEEGTGYVLKQYVTTSYDLKNAVKYSASANKKPSATTTTTPTTTDNSSIYNRVALCKVDSLNVRAAESTTSAIVGKMNKKTSGTILSKGHTWTKVQSGTVTGYIKNDYYVSGSMVPTYAKKSGVGQRATLKANMNIRAAASTSSARIGGAAKGSSFKIKQDLGNWISIAFGSKTGYLKKDYLTISYDFDTAIPTNTNNNTGTNTPSDPPITGNVSGDDIASYALQFKGAPYVYGGTSLTKGSDCSGFTQAIYKHFGYSIPRISRDQSNAGRSVSFDSLRKGDLIFYANTEGVINHVTLYIGDNKVIHSSNPTNGVIISTYTYRQPVKAVRILK